MGARAVGATALTRPALLAHGGLWTATLVPAAIVAAIPDAASRLRSILAFELQPSRGTIAEASAIAGQNGRLVLAVLLAAVVARHTARLRPLIEVPIVAVVGGNAALVGLALSAYGARGLPWLVHLPLEWAAIGNAASRYLADRHTRSSLSAVARAAVTSLALLVAASVVEVFLTPQS